MRPRAKEQRKDQVRVLCTNDEKAELAAAADERGMPVAVWLRTLGLRVARKQREGLVARQHLAAQGGAR